MKPARLSCTAHVQKNDGGRSVPSSRSVVSLFLALAAWHVPTLAADSIEHCVAIEDGAARLACFDAATGRPDRAGLQRHDTAVAATAATTPASPPAAAPTAARNRTPEQAAAEFGLSAAALAREQGIYEIAAVVQSVEQSSHIGRWVVTLDNGQVWEQRETTAPARRPRPGDQVTIKEASLDSYLLNAPGRGASRVRRIR